jgi:hypothetical protein
VAGPAIIATSRQRIPSAKSSSHLEATLALGLPQTPKQIAPMVKDRYFAREGARSRVLRADKKNEDGRWTAVRCGGKNQRTFPSGPVTLRQSIRSSMG